MPRGDDDDILGKESRKISQHERQQEHLARVDDPAVVRQCELKLFAVLLFDNLHDTKGRRGSTNVKMPNLLVPGGFEYGSPPVRFQGQ